MYILFNTTALAFFVLFALLFVGIVWLYIYSMRVKRRVKNSADKFSTDLQLALSRLDDTQAKLAFINQTEHRIRTEKKYENNDNGRNLLLSKVFQHKATVLFRAGRLKEAVKACDQVLQAEPSHVQTLLNRASLLGELGRYDEAIADFNGAELLDAYNPDLFNNRGWVQLQLARYEEAISDFHRAIHLKATAVSYFNRSKAYVALQRWAEAEADLAEAEKLHPEPELKKMMENLADEVRLHSNQAK